MAKTGLEPRPPESPAAVEARRRESDKRKEFIASLPVAQSPEQRPPDWRENLREARNMSDEVGFLTYVPGEPADLDAWDAVRQLAQTDDVLEREKRIDNLWRMHPQAAEKLGLPKPPASPPTKDPKPSSSSEKPERVRHRKKRELTGRDKEVLEILKADAEGKLHGSVYCWTLEKKKIPPRPEWVAKGCPTTYPEAYKLNKWTKRIQDEKYRLSLFLPKKRARHSPRRVKLVADE